jgi:hypothetical protein
MHGKGASHQLSALRKRVEINAAAPIRPKAHDAPRIETVIDLIGRSRHRTEGCAAVCSASGLGHRALKTFMA